MQKENKKATVRVNVEHNPGAKSSKEYTLHGDWQDIEGVLELAFSSIKKTVNTSPLCKVTLEYIPAGTEEEQTTAPEETSLEALSKEMQSFKDGIVASVDKLHAKADNLLRKVSGVNGNLERLEWTFRSLNRDMVNLKNDIKGIRKSVESLADNAEPEENKTKDLHEDHKNQFRQSISTENWAELGREMTTEFTGGIEATIAWIDETNDPVYRKFEQNYFNSFKKLRERREQHIDAMLNKFSNEIKIDISKKVEAIKALKREIKELKSRL